MSIITLNTRSLPDSAVTTAKVAADAITDAKIADDVVGTEHLTAGEVDATALGADSVTAAKINNDIISGSTELASEPADTDEFLVSDAGTLKRIDYSLIKGGGKISQVVSTTKTDTFSESVSSAGDSSLVTGLTVNVTPSASSSKILIFVNINMGADGEHGLGITLFRDSTQIDLADASSSRKRMSKGKIQNSGSSEYSVNLSTNHLDSPSSTSQITYGVKLNHTSGSSKTMYVNRSHTDNNDAQTGRSTSTITVMEVLA